MLYVCLVSKIPTGVKVALTQSIKGTFQSCALALNRNVFQEWIFLRIENVFFSECHTVYCCSPFKCLSPIGQQPTIISRLQAALHTISCFSSCNLLHTKQTSALFWRVQSDGGHIVSKELTVYSLFSAFLFIGPRKTHLKTVTQIFIS